MLPSRFVLRSCDDAGSDARGGVCAGQHGAHGAQRTARSARRQRPGKQGAHYAQVFRCRRPAHLSLNRIHLSRAEARRLLLVHKPERRSLCRPSRTCFCAAQAHVSCLPKWSRGPRKKRTTAVDRRWRKTEAGKWLFARRRVGRLPTTLGRSNHVRSCRTRTRTAHRAAAALRCPAPGLDAVSRREVQDVSPRRTVPSYGCGVEEKTRSRHDERPLRLFGGFGALGRLGQVAQLGLFGIAAACASCTGTLQFAGIDFEIQGGGRAK